VGGGHDPDVHRERTRRAHPLHLPELEGAQELRLEVERQLPDLVEEDGPAVRLLEGPLAQPVGAREGPLLVPEQLALDEGLGDGRAVDRDEGRLATPRSVVDGAGDELLAGAGLAENGDKFRAPLRAPSPLSSSATEPFSRILPSG
jgi:hypothetical protein